LTTSTWIEPFQKVFSFYQVLNCADKRAILRFARQARVAGTSGTSTARVLSYQDFPILQAPGAEFLEN
jgi:hypothetical protein